MKTKTFMMLVLAGLFMVISPPMSYSTNADLIDNIDQNSVIQLIDDEGINLPTIAELELAAADETHVYYAEAVLQLQRIEKARTRANELIKTWLRGHIPDVPSETLTHTEVDLTIYYLYSRRMRADMPKGISEGYNKSIDTLKELQKGGIKTADSPGVATAKIASNKKASDRLFSRERLKGYS